MARVSSGATRRRFWNGRYPHDQILPRSIASTPPRAREEIAPHQDQQHPGRRQDEQRRVEVPGHRGDDIVERANTAVGVIRRDPDRVARRSRMRLARAVLGRIEQRRRPDHDAAVVRQPERPRELEERVDEDRHQQQHLDLDQHRVCRHERQPLEHLPQLAPRPQQRGEAAQRDRTGRGKERIALTQLRHHHAVQHPVLALGHVAHPRDAVALHRADQAASLQRRQPAEPLVAPQRQHEPRDGDEIEHAHRRARQQHDEFLRHGAPPAVGARPSTRCRHLSSDCPTRPSSEQPGRHAGAAGEIGHVGVDRESAVGQLHRAARAPRPSAAVGRHQPSHIGLSSARGQHQRRRSPQPLLRPARRGPPATPPAAPAGCGAPLAGDVEHAGLALVLADLEGREPLTLAPAQHSRERSRAMRSAYWSAQLCIACASSSSCSAVSSGRKVQAFVLARLKPAVGDHARPQLQRQADAVEPALGGAQRGLEADLGPPRHHDQIVGRPMDIAGEPSVCGQHREHALRIPLLGEQLLLGEPDREILVRGLRRERTRVSSHSALSDRVPGRQLTTRRENVSLCGSRRARP